MDLASLAERVEHLDASIAALIGPVTAGQKYGEHFELPDEGGVDPMKHLRGGDGKFATHLYSVGKALAFAAARAKADEKPRTRPLSDVVDQRRTTRLQHIHLPRLDQELTDDFARTAGQGGSNPGARFRVRTERFADEGLKYGDELYVKTTRSPSHAAHEAVASLLYKAAGIDMPDMYADTSDSKIVASKIVDGTSVSGHLDDAEVMARVHEGFTVDAWLANWDVIGGVYDNIIIGDDGTPYRIDVGGALGWRARGDAKGDMFGTNVGELDSLRGLGVSNPTARTVFGTISPEEMAAGAERISKINDPMIHRIVAEAGAEPELADKLIARRDDIVRKLLNRVPGIPAADAVDNRGTEAPSAPVDQAAIDDLVKYAADHGVTLKMTINKATDKSIIPVKLDSIVADKRNQGAGTGVMERVLAVADEHGWTLGLDPSTQMGGESVARLSEFYSRFGFHQNIGGKPWHRTTPSKGYKPTMIRRGRDLPPPVDDARDLTLAKGTGSLETAKPREADELSDMFHVDSGWYDTLSSNDAELTDAQHASYLTGVGEAVDALRELFPDGFPGEGRFGVMPTTDANMGGHGRFVQSAGQVVLNADSEHVGMTAIHEIGHAMDWELGDTDRFATAHGGGPVGSAMSDLIVAARATETLSKLKYSSDPYAAYLNQPHEIWARAFAQWTARRVGGPLQDQLTAVQSIQNDRPRSQWVDDAEFDSVLGPKVEAVLAAAKINVGDGHAPELAVAADRADDLGDGATHTLTDSVVSTKEAVDDRRDPGSPAGTTTSRTREQLDAAAERASLAARQGVAWTRTGRSGSSPDAAGGLPVVARYELTSETAQTLSEVGADTRPYYELDNSPEAAAGFAAAITASKNGKYGAAVYVYPTDEYANMRLFLSDDGQSGVAVKPDGDIVSGFGAPDHSGDVYSILPLAIQNGGTKTDAFDTVLPDMYKKFGMAETKRDVWNDEYRPDDWDEATFAKWNQGRPDIVYMELGAPGQTREISLLTAPTVDTATQAAEREWENWDGYKGSPEVPASLVEQHLSPTAAANAAALAELSDLGVEPGRWASGDKGAYQKLLGEVTVGRALAASPEFRATIARLDDPNGDANPGSWLSRKDAERADEWFGERPLTPAARLAAVALVDQMTDDGSREEVLRIADTLEAAGTSTSIAGATTEETIANLDAIPVGGTAAVLYRKESTRYQRTADGWELSSHGSVYQESSADVERDSRHNGTGLVVEKPVTLAEMSEVAGIDLHEHIGRKVAARMQDAWMAWEGGSGDELSYELQAAASSVFNSPIPEASKSLSGEVKPNDLAALAVKARYEATQARLRKLGIGPDDDVVLWRGVKPEHSVVGKLSIEQNPLSSWSTAGGIAYAFSQRRSSFRVNPAIIRARVKSRYLFSTALDGFGASLEHEAVVIGPTVSGEAFNPHDLGVTSGSLVDGGFEILSPPPLPKPSEDPESVLPGHVFSYGSIQVRKTDTGGFVNVATGEPITLAELKARAGG